MGLPGSGKTYLSERLQPPQQVDFHIKEWNDHNHIDIAERINADV